MPKTIHTPREELVCGKLDALVAGLAELRERGAYELMALVEEIRMDCERMEAKLAQRKAEVAELRAQLPAPTGDTPTGAEDDAR